MNTLFPLPPSYKRRLAKRMPSRPISPEDVPLIKKRINQGEYLNRIAADYDCNPGRIAEIKMGKKFRNIPAAP